MLLGENRELENQVLLALGRHGSRSVDILADDIKRMGSNCSVQGIYRVLKKLHKERVIIKSKQCYSISLPWMMQLMQFTDHMGQLYLGAPYAAQLLPTGSISKRIWKCRNLQTLNDVWTQLLTMMGQLHKDSVGISYVPHLWFSLTDLTRWTKTKQVFLTSLNKHFLVIGHQSYADKYLGALLTLPEKESVYYAPDDEPLAKNRCDHITVIGDYVLSVSIDDTTAARIDSLCARIKSEDDIQIIDILAATAAPLNATVKIKYDPRLAASYRGKFQRLFGPLR